jgi:hypothetical protein
MESISPRQVYSHLDQLDQVDVSTSARYREEAQEVLGDPSINLSLREAIADRLNTANHLLTLQTVKGDDSY